MASHGDIYWKRRPNVSQREPQTTILDYAGHVYRLTLTEYPTEHAVAVDYLGAQVVNRSASATGPRLRTVWRKTAGDAMRAATVVAENDCHARLSQTSRTVRRLRAA
jgi:hypothetical protein